MPKLKLAPVVKLHDFQADLRASVDLPDYGDAVAFAVVTVKADGSTTYQFNHGEAGVARLLGAVEILRARIIREMLE